MLLPAFPQLVLRPPAWRGTEAPWRAILPAEAALFARGRFALCEGLRLLSRERGVRRVWIPAYVCSPVIEVLEALGLEARLYDVDDRLAPRLEALEPDPRSALLVVHYFGLAQDLGGLQARCRALGMALVEDCAHALPDPTAPLRMGAVGEIAVFSLRKQAPVPGGGLLVVNDAGLRAARAPAARPGLGDARTLLKLGIMAAERLALVFGVNILLFKDRLPVLDASDRASRREVGAAYRDPPAPSGLIVPMLRGVRWLAMIHARQDGYARLVERLGAVPGVDIAVPVLPAGSVPQALPVRVAEPAVAVQRLRRGGVEAMRWPGAEQIPFDRDACPGAAVWLDRGLMLPLGVPLTPRRLDAMVRAVRAATATGERRAVAVG